MDLKDVLKISTTGLAGLFSGAALYINLADTPARMTLDTKNCRKHWKEAFNRAKIFQGGMSILGSSLGATVYYLDKDSDSRKLWLIGSGIFIMVLPFTMFVMKPDIYKNLKDDAIETLGETWVRDHIQRWNKQHMVRTLLSMVAFDIFLYALTRK